jgi:hypothetical protein
VDASGVAIGFMVVLDASSPPLGALIIKRNITQAKLTIIDRCFILNPPFIPFLCKNPL